MLPTAGWLPDPLGEDSLRWWDGAAWTDHVIRLEAPSHAPERIDLDQHREELSRSAASAGRWVAAAAAPLDDPDSAARVLPSTITKGILLFSLCPAIVPLALVAVAQFSALGVPTPGEASTTVAVGIVVAVLAMFVCARMDRRELQQLRLRVAPSMLWSLLPLGYQVVRSIRLRRASAPTGGAIIASLLVMLAASAATGVLFASADSIPTASAGGSIVQELTAANVEQRVTEQLALQGEVYDNVSCPSVPSSFSVGSRFQCTATDASGAPATLSVVVGDHLQLGITAG